MGLSPFLVAFDTWKLLEKHMLGFPSIFWFVTTQRIFLQHCFLWIHYLGNEKSIPMCQIYVEINFQK